MGADFSIAPAQKQTVSEDSHPLFWSPGRLETQLAPEGFRKRLKEIDEDLECAWDRSIERWNVWVRKPQLRHPLARGWQLLFTVKNADGSFAPLDERTFSKLVEISARKWGNAVEYHRRVCDEMDRDKEKAAEDRKASIADGGSEYFDYLQPKVSMFGPSNGSKCANND